jgi:alanyl-tRNA synthetase
MITSDQVREKYLKFFEKRGHKIINPAPLVLENDPTTLFTSSGMQPLVPYLMGEPHNDGKRLVDSQPAIRLQDIDEVGDNRHTTYFKMLGNWSLGDYFKKEQLSWIWEFLTKELRLPKEKLYVSVFEGDGLVPKDLESKRIWLDLGVGENQIFEYGVKKNWWSRSGTPSQMPVGEIGGPDSEIFFDFGDDLKLHENSQWKDEVCHPNCDCGRFLEIGNSVFIQYKKTDMGLEELPQRNVDFGGGLERITAALNNDPDMFKTDIYWPTIEKLEKITGKQYDDQRKNFRIIADHLRASEALIKDGLVPSNKMHGYVLRRLIRRIATKIDDFEKITDNRVIIEELKKFKVSLDKGLKEISKVEKITGKIAFNLYQSYGFPLELTVELFREKGQEVNLEEFRKEFEGHKEKSRSLSSGVFKGGLADHSPEVVKLHTATHLLLASLRKVLGPHVIQKGQNIIKERCRFDFPHTQKLDQVQLKEVEDMVNNVIKRGLPVSYKVMPKDEAIKTGAIHAFNEKYADTVKVYTIGDFSNEFCGGPHVENTKEIGHVTIKKQEKIGSGIIRIYAVLT